MTFIEEMFTELRSGKTEKFYQYIENKGDLSIRNENDISLFYVLCANDLLNEAKMMYQLGVNIDENNVHGITPLLISSYNGNLDIAIWLIELGANINAEDVVGVSIVQLLKDKNTFFYLAPKEKQKMYFEVLSKHAHQFNENFQKDFKSIRMEEIFV
jgi:ankyrin repeat protein